MSSPVSKRKIQKLKDEIEELKQKNHDQKEEYDDEIQYLENKNRDLSYINANLTTENQRLKEENRKLVAVLDENKDLQKTNHDQNEAHGYEDQIQKQRLRAKFDNSKVSFERLTLSPVSVDKLQHCTEWWCPKHSDFATIVFVEKFKPKTEEDKIILNRAKGRFRYWNGKDDGLTCCKNDRQNKDRAKFSPPSNWPK